MYVCMHACMHVCMHVCVCVISIKLNISGGSHERPTPSTLIPQLYIPHPTPYTLQPTPYTLHPTPHTLHLKRGSQVAVTGVLQAKLAL